MTTLKRYNGTDWEYVGLPTNVGMSPQTIGYASYVAGGTTAIVASQQLPGLSTTVVVPEGRRLRISMFACFSGGTTCETNIRDNGVPINRYYEGTVSGITTHEWSVIESPSAGTHTYTAHINNASAGTLYADGTNEAWILVEDITGSTLPYQPASVPVGVLAYSPAITNQTSIVGGSAVSITGLSANVVVPAGRTLRVTGYVLASSPSAGLMETTIRMDGAVIGRFHDGAVAAAELNSQTPIAIISPAAGAHTFDVQLHLGAGTGQTYADSIRPLYILVEDITPTPAPANTAPSSTLAYVEKTDIQASITTEVAVTGLTTTVTVPAGRRIRLTTYGLVDSSAVGDVLMTQIKEGATPFVQAKTQISVSNATNQAMVTASTVLSPSAGIHTYNVTLARETGTGTARWVATPTAKSYLLVEDITGSGVSGHTHTELDDTGWISLLPYLVNGWVSYDNTYGPPRFRKKAGIVYVEGLVKNGSAGAVIANLPVGFRFHSGLPKLLFPSVGGEPTTGTRVDVESNGNIIHIGSLTGWFTLSGIIYPVD